MTRIEWVREAPGVYKSRGDGLWRLFPIFIGSKRVRYDIQYAGEKKADSRTLAGAKKRAQEILDKGVNVNVSGSSDHGLKAECYMRRYRVEMSVTQMTRILDHDKDHDHNVPLYVLLDKNTDAVSIEYDGHFGAQVIFSLLDEDDTPARRDEICKIIRDVAGPP